MKELFNPEYIEYKLFFMLAAFEQSINENLIKLLITVNDNQIYFPKFICFYPNTVYIDLGEIDNIVNKIIYLNYCKKDNETKS